MEKNKEPCEVYLLIMYGTCGDLSPRRRWGRRAVWWGVGKEWERWDGGAEEDEQTDPACQRGSGLTPSPSMKRLMQSGGAVIDGWCHYAAGTPKCCHYHIKLSSRRPEFKVKWKQLRFQSLMKVEALFPLKS